MSYKKNTDDFQTLGTKKRLTELDFLRIAGFVMVVAQHILGSYAGRPETYTGAALFFHTAFLFGRPAVPLFIALTAFTLLNSNFDKPFNPKLYFGKKMINIVLPYLFWSFFYMLYYHKDKLLHEVVPVLIAGQASYHLWYVGMVVRLYILFPLVLVLVTYVIKKNKKLVKPMIGIALLLFYGLSVANNLITDNLASFIGGGVKNFYVVRFLNYSPFYYMGYFVMGAIYYFQREKVKIWVVKNCWWLTIAYVPMSIYMYVLQSKRLMPLILQGVQNNILIKLLFTCMTIVLLFRVGIFVAEKAQGKAEKLITKLGKLSFGAYLVHVLMINEISRHYLQVFKPNGNLIAGLVIYTFAIAFSFLLAYLLDKIPFAGYLIGTGKLKRKINVT